MSPQTTKDGERNDINDQGSSNNKNKMGAEHNQDQSNYYAGGSSELATETPLTLNRLEVRRKLTRNSNRLVIALVGLPARGKSFVARKLQNFLIWYGIECKIFNVGRYRRRAHAEATSSSGACDANFFDAKNSEAAALRERVASIALEEMLEWLDGNACTGEHDNADDESSAASSRSSSSCGYRPGQPHIAGLSDRIAIFDATNSTDKRRQWLLEQCTSPEKRPGKPTGLVFVESICDDQELLLENFRFKISNSPDYKGMNEDDALADLRNRVRKYEEQYETIADDSLSYIKIFNLSSKLLVNHIYGRMSKVIVPALMAWNIGTRPVYLCRSGQTAGGSTEAPTNGVPKNVPIHHGPYLSPGQSGRHFSSAASHESSSSSRRQNMRGNRLSASGRRFSEALFEFLQKECHEFQMKRSSIMDMAPTGTSLTGLAGAAVNVDPNSDEPPFPLQVFTSTMPRAVETARWDDSYAFRIDELSNLNPLDKGDYAEKDIGDMEHLNPEWYTKLSKYPFHTRFPGGESYRDLIRRLESTIVDVEQQVIPTLVVAHVSTLQILMAYFRGSPVEKCMSNEVPMHTVLKYTPVRGGGWKESQHRLAPVDDQKSDVNRSMLLPAIASTSEMSALSAGDHSFKGERAGFAPVTPIWGDHVRQNSTHVTFNEKMHSLPL